MYKIFVHVLHLFCVSSVRYTFQWTSVVTRLPAFFADNFTGTARGQVAEL